MGESSTDAIYVLIVKDDLSGYIWFRPCDNEDSVSTTSVLVEWSAAFGVPRNWMSDQGSHLKNKVMSSLAKKLRVDHKFSLPYSPWSNGTVEVVCRELIRATRAILSEAQLSRKEWRIVLPIVQAALNSSCSKRWNGRCSLTVFTGLAIYKPISTAIQKSGRYSLVKYISDERAKVCLLYTSPSPRDQRGSRMPSSA